MTHGTRVSWRNAATASPRINPTISSWGVLTEHTGTWRADGTVACGNAECAVLPDKWNRMADGEPNWPAMQDLECDCCKTERERRNRIMAAEDPRVRREPFLSAPFIHNNNEPKYHAILLRAHEQAKHQRKHVLWFALADRIDNTAQIATTPAKLEPRLQRLLQYHDQQTARVPGFNPFYDGHASRGDGEVGEGEERGDD